MHIINAWGALTVFSSQPEIDVITFLILFIFPSILNTQFFIITKQNQSKGGSVLKSGLFFALYSFTLQCEINIVKENHYSWPMFLLKLEQCYHEL